MCQTHAHQGEVSGVVGNKGAMRSHPFALVGFAWWYGQFLLVMCNYSICICVCVCARVCVCVCMCVHVFVLGCGCVLVCRCGCVGVCSECRRRCMDVGVFACVFTY